MPTGRFVFGKSSMGGSWLVLLRRPICFFRHRLVCYAQQRRGFRAPATQFFVPRLVLVHPPYGPVVPRPGLLLIPQLPVGHSEEEPFHAVAARAEFRCLVQCCNRCFPIACPVTRHAQRAPTATPLWRQLDRFLG